MLNKKLLVSAILVGAAVAGTSLSASATVPGFYVGAQAGWNSIHYSAADLNLTTASFNRSDYGIRPFLGYQVDQNWGLELGYAWFGNVKESHSDQTITVKDTIKESTIDLALKASLPLDSGFGLYAKGGAAYVTTDVSGDPDPLHSGKVDGHKVRPLAAVGLSYDLSDNVSTDISWTRIFSGAGLPNTDFAAISLAYSFG